MRFPPVGLCNITTDTPKQSKIDNKLQYTDTDVRDDVKQLVTTRIIILDKT